MARLATVIELPEVAITDPLVRSASVFVPVGAMDAVMLMFPELLPLTSPIRTTLALSRFISLFSKTSLVVVVVLAPRSIWRSAITGAMVTAPDPEVAVTAELTAMLFAFSSTPDVPPEEMAEPTVMSVAVIEVFPEEVRDAVDEKAPDPVTVMFPEFVVVCAPLTVTAPPMRFRSPAIE